MDNKWRPENWASIKRNILMETTVTWSPSTGYNKGQSDQIVEKTAAAILDALLAELSALETKTK